MIAPTTYRERLHVPLRWWVQGVMFIATIWIAVILWVPAALAWTITGVIVGLFALGMQSFGSARVEVRDGWFYAGKARISAAYLRDPEALDRDTMWQVAGPKADARAFLLLRPYVHRGVKVSLEDPEDRTPYWLIATRHPDQLVQALAEAIRTHADAAGD